MNKYITNFFETMYEGLRSIGEGFSTFTFFPDTGIKPYSSEEAWKQNNEDIRKDWENVGKHIDNAVKKLSENQPTN